MNNNIGGVYINNSIYLYWNIGRRICEKNKYQNIIEKYSNYLSYYYGNSYFFTRENIHYMKRFYLDFPIYYDKLCSISWEQYRLLLKIRDKKERFFYYRLSLLFKSDYKDTLEFIDNKYYFRI